LRLAIGVIPMLAPKNYIEEKDFLERKRGRRSEVDRVLFLFHSTI